MKTPPVTSDRIMELAYAFRGAKALLSAVELGVFGALTGGRLNVDALGRRIGIHRRGACDFFDALVALGLLCRDADGCYSNSRASDRFLVPGKSSYIGGLLSHLNTREYPHWNMLTRALLTGAAQFGSGEAGHYQELYANPAAVEEFAQAMSGGSLLVAKALAQRFPWDKYKTVIDVGSAEGCLPVEIAQVHAHLSGGGFDLPPLAGAFISYVHKHGLSERLSFYSGDFLQDPLPAADVLVMGRVLHNWDLSTKKMLLGKAYAALPRGGALIIYERLIDDERRVNSVGLLASLNMLIMTEGGFDYSAADCIGWMQQEGFRDMYVEPLTGDQTMIVGTK